jgi:phospho-N-acetylmuramoyl-pentapeptide-transferase
MLYQLFDWLKSEGTRIPGGNLFLFITFRVLLALLLSLIISSLVGKKIINFLRKKQIERRDSGWQVRNKKGTPTMVDHHYSRDLTNFIIG